MKDSSLTRVIYLIDYSSFVGLGKLLSSELSVDSLLAGVDSNNGLLGGRSISLLLIGLSEVDLNVARRGLVRVDSSVGSVSTAALLRSLVNLDVRDDKLVGVKALGVGVGLGVLEQVRNKLDTLNGPSGLGKTPLLGLTSSTNRSGMFSERNSSLLVGDLLKVGKGLLDVPSADSVSGLVGVLERGSQVRSTSGGTLGRVDRVGAVTSHFGLEQWAKSKCFSLCRFVVSVQEGTGCDGKVEWCMGGDMNLVWAVTEGAVRRE